MMIKTLRITSIVAAVLAGILFVFPVVFGARHDGQIEQFLNSAGVVAKFKEATGSKVKDSESQVSPIVKQAEAFALYLSPPPNPRPVVQAPPVESAPRPPAPVSPKFTLVATVLYQSRPEQSLAFIDEPGKGMHWVRQSGEVGHLVIEQVKDASVVVRDGQRTFEIAIQQQPAGINLLESSSSGAMGQATAGFAQTSGKPTLPASPAPPALEEPSVSAVSTPVSARPSLDGQLPPSETAAPEISAEEESALEKLIAQLASLQKGSGSDKTGSADSNEEEAAAVMEKLMGDLKATRVSAEEAKKLNGLGKELEGVQPSSGKGLRPDERDPNLPAPAPPTRSGRTETRVRRPPIRPPTSKR